MINKLIAYIIHLFTRYHKNAQNKNQTVLSWLFMVKVTTCIWRTANSNHVKEEKNYKKNSQQKFILQKCNQCQHYLSEDDILPTLLILIKYTIEMTKSRSTKSRYVIWQRKTKTFRTFDLAFGAHFRTYLVFLI